MLLLLFSFKIKGKSKQTAFCLVAGSFTHKQADCAVRLKRRPTALCTWASPCPVASSPPALLPHKPGGQHSSGGFVSYRPLYLCLASNLFPSVHLPSHLKSHSGPHPSPLDFPHQLPWTTGSVSCGAPKRPLEASCVGLIHSSSCQENQAIKEPHSMFLRPQNLCSGSFLCLKSTAPQLLRW